MRAILQEPANISGFLSVSTRMSESDRPEDDTPQNNDQSMLMRQSAKHRMALSVYGYSFWRLSNGGQKISAPTGQYGGSQTAVIVGYDLKGKPGRGAAIVGRIAATPNYGAKEIALGLRLQKPAALPLSITAERRIRSDGKDDWAAYAAGGIDTVRLPARFSLNAYAQAGWSTGKDGGGFFDAQARALRPAFSIGSIPVRIGAGLWAGGQKDLHRFDIGPTLATEIDTDLAKFDFRLDWRQRVAGNAAPKDGLALTVTTGF
ncbi:MAG: hypothetical protein ACRCY3_07925 [Sphingorhabdus sp.]